MNTESTIKTHYVWWWQMEFQKALEYATHCRPIIEHVDHDPKKSCLLILGLPGILVIPYGEHK
jgi:hypothetical protein